jgi:hypothetical protein
MTFRSALTELSTLSVSGVANNYDVDAVPETPHRAQLPALLVLPIDFQDERVVQEQGKGFQTVAFSSGAKTVRYIVTHLLLVAPVVQSKGIRAHLPTLVDRIDSYFAALANDITLGGTLLEPASVRVDPGIFTFGGVEYYGCAFRHSWLIQA